MNKDDIDELEKLFPPAFEEFVSELRAADRMRALLLLCIPVLVNHEAALEMLGDDEFECGVDPCDLRQRIESELGECDK